MMSMAICKAASPRTPVDVNLRYVRLDKKMNVDDLFPIPFSYAVRFWCNLSLSLYSTTGIKTSGDIQIAELFGLFVI